MTREPALGLGIGWRPEVAALALERDDLGFVEVIAESVDVGAPLPLALDEARARGMSIVPHGIGLSLGGAERVDRNRLAALARVAVRVDAPMVSEHAAFVRAAGVEAGHLLPVPRTRAALAVLVENIRVAMAELPVPLAVENGAAVFEWPDAELDEAAFIAELVERSGCTLLLDLANLFVNSVNHGFDPLTVLARLPLERVAYVHTAGGIARSGLLHDTHAHPLWPEVVELLEELASRTAIPGVLLERDDRFPPRAELSNELDTLASAWARGDSRRISSPSRPPCAIAARSAVEPAPHARSRLARDQSALVKTLAGGAPDPAGFPSVRLDAARRALLHKRAREARAAWPGLASYLGDQFDERFVAWASARPGRGGGRADALDFVGSLPARERRRLPRRLQQERQALRHVRLHSWLRGEVTPRRRHPLY